jgi:hypothetical protein
MLNARNHLSTFQKPKDISTQLNNSNAANDSKSIRYLKTNSNADPSTKSKRDGYIQTNTNHNTINPNPSAMGIFVPTPTITL